MGIAGDGLVHDAATFPFGGNNGATLHAEKAPPDEEGDAGASSTRPRIVAPPNETRPTKQARPLAQRGNDAREGSSADSGGTTDPREQGTKAAPAAGRSFSIRVASRLTGIPADTLRMWERRYGFPHPKRTGGGSRTYTEEDIELLELVSRAIKSGYRPGEVVGKGRAELLEIVTQVTQVTPTRHEPALDGGLPTVQNLIDHLCADDAETLATEMRRAALRLGSKQFVTELAHPFAVEVGAAWEAGRLEVRHEHLASEVLSTLLRLLLSTTESSLGRPTVLLATLPGELHGLGLEMVALYLAAQHAKPRLIGVRTPRDQIVKAARALGADVVGLTLTPTSDLNATIDDIRWMLSELPRRVEVWIGGSAANKLGLTEPGLKSISSFAELEAAIASARNQ